MSPLQCFLLVLTNIVISVCQVEHMCQKGALLCDFGRSFVCERTQSIMRCTFLPLTQQTLSLTGLMFIIIITEAIISSHPLQDICKAIRFVYLLIQLDQHHHILQIRHRICCEEMLNSVGLFKYIIDAVWMHFKTCQLLVVMDSLS